MQIFTKNHAVKSTVMKNTYPNPTTRIDRIKALSFIRKLGFISLLVLFLVTTAGNLWSQVSVDATSSGSATAGSSITVSHTTGAGSDRLMLVGISSRDRTVTGVTYGGTALTLVGAQTSNGNAKTAIYRLIAPASGTASVVVSFSGTVGKGAVVGVMTFTGVNQTTPLGTYASNVGNSTNATLNVTSASSELVFNVVSVQNQNVNNTTGQTQRWNVNTASECTGAGCTKPGSANTSLSWTLIKDDWSMSGVSIKPLAASDIQITKSSTPTTPVLGSTVTFTLTATNNGPDAATGVTASDVLPNGFQYVSHSTATGTASYNSGNQTVTWSIGSLANGASATLTIDATVLCGNDYKNIATITGNQPDPETANNTAVLIISPQNTISTFYQICEGTTYNLTQHNPCNTPASMNVTWHTATPATLGNKVATPSAVPAGIYYAAFEDATNSCYSPATAFTIANYPTITASLAASPNPVLCNGGTTTLTVSASGGTGTLQYSLNGGPYQSGNTFTAGAGTYTVTVRDASPNPGPCTVTTNTVTVTQPTALSISLVAKTDVSCNGQSTGSITIAGNGGTVPYSYSINGTNYYASGTFTGLAAGPYTLYTKDLNNCGPVTLSVTITEPAASLSLIPTVIQPTCYIDGSITLVVSGGTTPYTCDWSDLPGTSNPEDRTGLLPGTYSVTVTDANGCTIVSGPHILSTPVDCIGYDVCRSDAASVFSVYPDPENDSYIWTVPPGAVIVSGQGTPSIVINWSDVTPGTYQVCVVAHNICGTTSQICRDVYVHEAIATASASPVCEGGALELFASGGVSYYWTGPSGFTSSSANPIIFNATALNNNGIYTVTVTNEDGCTATANVSVSVGAPPVLTGTVISPAACGQPIGSIDLNPSGGSGSYSYDWNNGATTQDLTSIPAGNYTVLVTDIVTLCSTEETYSVFDLDGPVASPATNDLSCYGDSNGSIDLTVTQSPAQTPYTYLWSNGATTEDIAGLSAGEYSVVVTDKNGCKGAASVTIQQPASLVIDEVHTNVSCYGGGGASITALVSGGTSPYSYSWTKDGSPFGSNTNHLTGLYAGTYVVTVLDNKGCTANLTITVTQPVAGLSAAQIITHVSCNGASDGQIILNVTGGTDPYIYSWSGPGVFSATSKDISNLPAGFYTVIITDYNGCILEIENIEITQPDALAVSGIPTYVSCYGSNGGAIDLTVTGGTPMYFYSWSNGMNTQDLTGLAAGTYSIIVTDGHGCQATASFTITEPPLLSASASAADAKCYGAATGSIASSVSGGTPSYTYLWSNGATSPDLTGVGAGTYSVTVTDSKGCTAVASATVNEPSGVVVTGVVTNILCYGGSTGEINITASGGTGVYTYDWDDISGTNDFEDRTGLLAGSYHVTVYDASNCTASATYTITQPAAVALSETHSNISCYGGSDGSIDLTVTGGVAPYTYLWSNAATTEDITGLIAGAYSVTVTDVNLCTAVLSGITISEPPLLVLTLSHEDVTCKGGNDGSATASPTGGTLPFSYLWSNGSTLPTASGLIAGSYSVVVTDTKGCTVNGSVTITEPSAEIELYATTVDASACGGNTGSIDLTVVNGISPFSYVWSNGFTNQDPSGLAAGTYSVTVTDADGCSATLSDITVSSAPTLVVTVTPYDRSCLAADGSAYAEITGGTGPYSYLWSTGATTSYITGLDAGTYSVTVTDANGCTDDGSGTVIMPSCSAPVALDDYFITCSGTVVTGSVASNDYDGDNTLSELEFLPLNGPTDQQGTIAWDPSYNGSFTFTPTPGYTGTLTITYLVEDPAGLTDEGLLTIYISQISAEITAANTTHESCGLHNGTATVAVTPDESAGFGPYSYSWNTTPVQSTTTASNLAAGTYTVTITDAKLCSVTASVTIENVCLTIVKTLYSVNGNTSATTYNATDDVITYHIVVTNTGTAALNGITVTDPLTGMNETIATLAPGASQTFTTTYTVLTSDLSAGSIYNIATANYSYNGQDYTTSDSETIQSGNADVSIVKTCTTSPVVAGQMVYYSITVTNAGPSTALNVEVADVNASLSNMQFSTDNVVWNPWISPHIIGTLNAGGTTVIYLKGTVPSSLTGNLVNTATVNSTNDNNTSNNSSTVTSPVTTSADMAITKICNTSPVKKNHLINYTITVVNNGPSDALSVSVADVINTIYISNPEYSTDGGTNWNPWTSPLNIGTLTVNSTYTFQLQGMVTDLAVSPLINTASVSSTTPDPDIDNNTASVSTTLNKEADLSIVKTDPASVTAGTQISYSITATNNDNNFDATNVTITDNINSSYISNAEYSDDGGSTWIVWSGSYPVASLNHGSSVTILIRGTVLPGVTTNVPNTASVNSNDVPDPVPGNNSSSTSTPVTVSADLRIIKTVTTSPVVAGGTITWDIEIRNLGPSNAVAVISTDALPTGLNTVQYSTDNGTTWTNWPADNTFILGDLAFNMTTGIKVRANVDVTNCEPITNTAHVTSSTPDPNLDNNTSISGPIPVIDQTPPSIICPATISVSCEASTSPTSTGTATATDNCTAAGAITISHTDQTVAGSCQNNYTINRIWTATDGSTNSSSCTQVITVYDNTPPTISCPSDVSVECTRDIPDVNTSAVTATDNCGGTVIVNWVIDEISDQTCANRYTLTRTYRATDACGNAATCQQVITVYDDTPATFDAPPAVTISCEQSTDPSNTGQPSNIVGNCGGTNQNWTYSDQWQTGPGCNGTGTILRTFTVTDQCGNSSTGTQTIVIIDGIFPQITCPADQVRSTNPGACIYTASGTEFNPLTATDNCGILSVVNNLNGTGTLAGYVFSKGTTTVIWTITDGCGQAASCSFTVTVNDNEDPAITCPADMNVPNDPGVCGAVVNYTAPVGTDNCPGATTEQIAGLPSGSTFLPGTTINTFQVTDAAGNAVTCSFNVTVDDCADLAIVKTDLPDPVTAGGALTYALTVTNYGPSQAQSVTVADVVPASVLSPQISLDGGTSWDIWQGSYSYGSLASGSSFSFMIRGTVSCDTPDGTLSNTSTVASTTAEGNSANNTSTATTQVTGLGTPGPIEAGQTVYCAADEGYTFSIPPVTGATGYTWTVPLGSTITVGQGTTTITMNAGSTSGNVCVEVSFAGCPGKTACLAIEIQNILPKPVFKPE